MSATIFIVAAEPSGDALGADLIAALRARDPALRFAGVGGRAMAAQGVVSPFDISDLAILGLAEALPAYRRVVQRADDTVAAAIAAQPDVAVLIDSWGFTLRVAQRLRAAAPHVRLVKYVGPQVWATRPGRAKTLAGVVHHLICIHDFEPPYYAPHGLGCTIAGHPAIGRHRPGNAHALRARLGIGDAPVLLVLPGSRRSEIRRVAPVLFRAADEVKLGRPQLEVLTVAADGVREGVLALAQATSANVRVLDETTKADAFAAATVALAASGTVTTEVALHGTPVIVGYKVGWLTWAIARAFLAKARFITLMNVAVDAEVAPEFVQTRFTVANLALAAARLIDHDRARAAQVSAQNAALERMGRSARPAAEIAAEAVLAQAAAAQAGPKTPAAAA